MRFRVHLRLAAPLLAAISFSSAVWGQTAAKPYAEIDPSSVSYRGPGRAAADDLAGTEVRVGLLVPLSGPQRPQGEALVQAAQMAIDDEAAHPLPDGRQLALVTRDEGGLWGRASSEIVSMLFDDQVVALVTSADGAAAHLAEQVGNKIGVPILTLSADSTTTEINLPWIFRLGPSDAAEARAFARDIYSRRRLARVALVTANDHDGRVGGDEFMRAAARLRASTPPLRISISSPDVTNVVNAIAAAHPQALVLWTGPEAADALLSALRDSLPSAPVYLCTKAAQTSVPTTSRERCRTCSGDSDSGGVWTVSHAPSPKPQRTAFEQKYQKRTGVLPTATAAEAYDAIRVLAAALRESGANRARLRDALVTLGDFSGVAGPISFDGAGNNRAKATVVPVP
jgi:branched-chain amino acid transport system substrate-binding protein